MALQLRAESVITIVGQAVEDYSHLSTVMTGPTGFAFELDQAVVLMEAEETLRLIVGAAPAVSTLAEVARQRGRDRRAREAAGEAVLKLQDRARVLHEAASAALQCAATHSLSDLGLLQESVERLSLLSEAHKEIEHYLEEQ
jgi:hypothetical protein